MKELLGVVVLSMPILAVLCIGGLAGYAGWAVSRRVIGAKRKWATRAATALGVILIFTWDEIAGRMYFRYLCANEGGVKVFKRAELPAEHWGDDGTPKDRIVREGTRFQTQIGNQYYLEHREEKDYSKIFRIDRDTRLMTDRKTGDVIGELVMFRFWGGWLAHNISLDMRAESCPTAGIGGEFYRRLFVRKSMYK